MTIIITGGSGFVGTALIKALLTKQKSSKIVILDLTPPKIELQDLVHFVYTDITDREAVLRAFQAFQDIECVFHVAGFGLAGTANLPAFNGKTRNVNVGGTRNIIDACIQCNAKALGMYFQCIYLKEFQSYSNFYFFCSFHEHSQRCVCGSRNPKRYRRISFMARKGTP